LSFIVTGWPVNVPAWKASSLSERLVQSGRAEKSGATVTNHFARAMAFCISAPAALRFRSDNAPSAPHWLPVTDVQLLHVGFNQTQTGLAYQTHARV
jgi:hypothetical protein